MTGCRLVERRMGPAGVTDWRRTRVNCSLKRSDSFGPRLSLEPLCAYPATLYCGSFDMTIGKNAQSRRRSMRMNGWVAAAIAACAVCVGGTQEAQAFGEDRVNIPPGFHSPRQVRHWLYYPRYGHHYYTNGSSDPFGYDYRGVGYYPCYNFGYWKPPQCVSRTRAHFIHPEYYPAWGSNVPYPERYHRARRHVKHSVPTLK